MRYKGHKIVGSWDVEEGMEKSARNGQRNGRCKSLKGDISKDSRNLKGRSKVINRGRKRGGDQK